MTNHSEADRRRYFRIDDEIQLTYVLLSEDDARRVAHQVRAGVKLASQLVGDLDRQDSLATLRAAIAANDSALAEYLNILEQQINDLTRFLAVEEGDPVEVRFHQVSLGGGGVAFESAEPVAIDASLDLRIVLPPKGQGVRALAQVTQCLPSGELYRVSAKFTVIDPKDRDQVMGRILTRQSEMLRQEKRVAG